MFYHKIVSGLILIGCSMFAFKDSFIAGIIFGFPTLLYGNIEILKGIREE